MPIDPKRFPIDDLRSLSENISKARAHWPLHVEAVCAETIALSQDIASAIGEISIEEANTVIIREFTDRIRGKKK